MIEASLRSCLNGLSRWELEIDSVPDLLTFQVACLLPGIDAKERERVQQLLV